MYGVYSLDSLPIYFDFIELNYYILNDNLIYISLFCHL